MTLQELQQKANPILVDFWNVLQNREDTYFANHGRYFQLLVSPEAPVVEGADSDFTVRFPHYEQDGGGYNLTYATKIPFQIEVHQWRGHAGSTHGYIAYVTVQHLDGRQFRRSRTSDNLDSGWEQVEVIN